jgi:hypothetical protein
MNGLKFDTVQRQGDATVDAEGVGMKIAAEGDFEAVARSVCVDPPQWLPVALAHYAVWIGDATKGLRSEFDKRIRQMQEAVRVLKNSLPMWEHSVFNAECPPAVRMVLDGLPGLKAELTRLERKGVGRPPDVQREVCAAIVIEAWRIIHGKVEARSEQLYRACNRYWTECGGAPLSPTSDIENWRHTVEQALKSDHSWIRDQLAWISSTKWTEFEPLDATVRNST